MDYEYRYRLFASVDLIGSTAYKQRSIERWVNVFQQFFDEFPRRIEEEFAKLPSSLAVRPADPLRVWKYVGDEILFETELRRHEEAAVHVTILKRAVEEYNSELHAKKALRGLALKACAWSAGFPVGNVEARLNSGSPDDPTVRDFLGPGLDLGFRLCQFADERRIPINVELAYLLVCTNLLPRPFSPTILYEKSVPLKGVLGGSAYPVLWVDRKDGDQTPEDRLLCISRDSNPSHVTAFVTEFFDRHDEFITKPFIIHDGNPEFSTVPTRIEQERNRLMTDDPEYSYRVSTESLESESEAMTGELRASTGLPTLPKTSPKAKAGTSDKGSLKKMRSRRKRT